MLLGSFDVEGNEVLLKVSICPSDRSRTASFQSGLATSYRPHGSPSIFQSAKSAVHSTNIQTT